MAHRRVKRTKIWASKIWSLELCSLHVGIFDLEHVKVIWGHSVHFFRKLGHNSKNAHCRGKRTEIGRVCSIHVGIFDFEHGEHAKVIWGHSLHFSENWAVTEKQLIIHNGTVKPTKLWASKVYVASMLVFFTLNMSRLFGVIQCTFLKIGP